MIKHLNGLYETADYEANANYRLYHNNTAEHYPVHWHTCIEIIMPLTNEYTVVFESCTQTLLPGEILFICPGVLHALKAPLQGERLIFQIDPAMLRQMESINSALLSLRPFLIITPAATPAIYQQVHTFFLDIQAEHKNTELLAEAVIYGKLLQIITLIRRNQPGENSTSFTPASRSQEHFEKFASICSYIDQHYAEALSLDEAARQTGFSKYHFSRLFKQYTSVSFYKYINIRRIAYAETLLIHPLLSITDIALQCGFPTMSAFIRMFKQMNGCTPTHFRQMYLNPL